MVKIRLFGCHRADCDWVISSSQNRQLSVSIFTKTLSWSFYSNRSSLKGKSCLTLSITISWFRQGNENTGEEDASNFTLTEISATFFLRNQILHSHKVFRSYILEVVNNRYRENSNPSVTCSIRSAQPMRSIPAAARIRASYLSPASSLFSLVFRFPRWSREIIC